MKNSKKSSATDSSVVNPEKALFDILSQLSLAQREAVRPEIEVLHKLTGGTQDLFVDRRKLTWGKDGVARKTLAEKPKKLEIQINWRSADCTLIMTMEDAAKKLKKTRPTLAALIHRHKGCWTFLDENDDVVTVCKIKPISSTPATK